MPAGVLREDRVKLNPPADFLLEEEITETVIFGYNETLPVVLRDLPENVSRVYMAGQKMNRDEKKELERIASERDIELEYCVCNPRSEKDLLSAFVYAKKISLILPLSALTLILYAPSLVRKLTS